MADGGSFFFTLLSLTFICPVSIVRCCWKSFCLHFFVFFSQPSHLHISKPSLLLPPLSSHHFLLSSHYPSPPTTTTIPNPSAPLPSSSGVFLRGVWCLRGAGTLTLLCLISFLKNVCLSLPSCLHVICLCLCWWWWCCWWW